MSLGSELKEARESRKIALEEVSRKTKIPEKYLEAIEENNFGIFPSQTYAKGFIRAYAKVVGIDQALLTRQFNAENEKIEMRIETKNAEADLERALGWRPTLSRPPVFRRPDTPTDLNLEIVEEDGYTEPDHHEPAFSRQRAAFFNKMKWSRWTSRAVAVMAVFLVLVAVVYFGIRLVSRIHWASPPPETASTTTKDFASVRVTDKYQHLVLKALDKSWVLVTMDDGQSSSETDMDQGEVKTYQAVKNFTLKLGNAGGVDVQFNGKPLGVLGTEGQVVEIQLPPASADKTKSGNDNS